MSGRWPLAVVFPWACAVPNNQRVRPARRGITTTRRWRAAREEAHVEAMRQSAGIRCDAESRFGAMLHVHAPHAADHGHAADIDAYVKLLLDALEGQVYEDDRQVDVMFIRRRWSVPEPHLVLTVWPLTTDGPSDAPWPP